MIYIENSVKLMQTNSRQLARTTKSGIPPIITVPSNMVQPVDQTQKNENNTRKSRTLGTIVDILV